MSNESAAILDDILKELSDESNKEMKELAIKTVANGIRFLESLNK